VSVATTAASAALNTDEVANQATPLEGLDTFAVNRPLREALEREGGGFAVEAAHELGRLAGRPEVIALGFQANEHPPVLHTHDRVGRRIDEVEFHPAWHELMRLGVGHGLHAAPWRDPRPGAHVARATLFSLLSSVEAGFGCPISMTYSIVPALRAQPELAADWEPGLTSLDYDPGLRAPASKRGLLAGMAMTEKQGGSDVRANTTVAEPVDGGGPGGEYALTGHKWFCSAPMCDVFLVLAQAPGGLSCFLVARVLPDGSRNAFHLQRLKDKLGNRSNASSEIELHGALARLVGEEGRGVPTIIEMVAHTRLDCCVGGATVMRQGVAHALHHTAERSAFGRRLIDQPLMINVLADLCVESEAATVTAMRLARAYDEAGESAEHGRFRRLATAVAKYWLCKRAPGHAHESLECLGGNGYVEASGLPRLYREAPLNGIWEGSGNVICLDVLRAMARDPGGVEAFWAEVDEAAGADPRLDAFVSAARSELTDLDAIESRARRVVERMALALQGSLLVRHAPAPVADAFCASRLEGDHGSAYGTLPPGLALEEIVERHRPAA